MKNTKRRSDVTAGAYRIETTVKKAQNKNTGRIERRKHVRIFDAPADPPPPDEAPQAEEPEPIDEPKPSPVENADA